MFTYCETLRSAGELNLRAIKLQAGFSEQPFTPDGQSDFIQVMEEQTGYVVEE